MNFEKYPWLADLNSKEAKSAIEAARLSYQKDGAATFPDFLTQSALTSSIQEARAQEDTAFTTNDVHTAYLGPLHPEVDPTSVQILEMRTQVASIAFDELPKDSALAQVYRSKCLRELVAKTVGKQDIFLSEDPLGCCSINVFRPGYHHSFHFDESEFSTTLMLQEASTPGSGLFHYTNPLRDNSDDLALESVAATISEYDDNVNTLLESKVDSPPHLHTLEFVPGTLSIFAGSKSLHRVTQVEGTCSRLVAVFTFASQPGFKNSSKVQKMFWGRSS